MGRVRQALEAGVEAEEEQAWTGHSEESPTYRCPQTGTHQTSLFGATRSVRGLAPITTRRVGPSDSKQSRLKTVAARRPYQPLRRASTCIVGRTRTCPQRVHQHFAHTVCMADGCQKGTMPLHMQHVTDVCGGWRSFADSAPSPDVHGVDACMSTLCMEVMRSLDRKSPPTDTVMISSLCNTMFAGSRQGLPRRTVMAVVCVVMRCSRC